MSTKNIPLEKTSIALQDLKSALSECSAILSEKQINADAKDVVYQQNLQNAQRKIDMLTQCSQNAAVNINELAAKIDKVLS